MANHKSAEKRNRQNIKKNERNRTAKAAIRTAIKKARVASESKDPTAKELARKAESLLAKAAAKGILNKKTARRTTSRVSAKVAAK